MPESPTGKSLLLPFLRNLLDDVNQECAVWIDKPNGIFKLVDPHRVAKLWGKETGNPKMNYDKMSRGLRDHYKKGLKKVPGKDARYQFINPKALSFNISNILVPKKEGSSLSSSPTSSSSGSSSPLLQRTTVVPLINPLVLQESLRENMAQFNQFMMMFFPLLHKLPIQEQLRIFFISKNTYPMLFPAPYR
ncbi:unnamed protein product [Caenorhabditis nigoni]